MPISLGKRQSWRAKSPSLMGAFLSACVMALAMTMILGASGAKLSPDGGFRRDAGDGIIADPFREAAGGHGGEMMEFEQGRSSRGRMGMEGGDGGRGRRADDVSPVNGPMSGQTAVMYDLALKSSTGSRLGQYTLGTSDLVVLGFGQNVIVSARADLGNYFYTDPDLLFEVPGFPPCPSGSTCAQIVAGTSSELSCFVESNEIACYVYNSTFAVQREPITSVFANVPIRIKDSRTVGACTTSSPLGCFGSAISVWKQAVAVVRGDAASYYVNTYYHTAEHGNFSRSAGADTFANSLSLMRIETSGTAKPSIALEGTLMAIGNPTNRGSVRLLRAVGSGAEVYGAHRAWSLVAEIEADGDAAGFGASVSLGPNVLVVGAPGNTTHAARIVVYNLASGMPVKLCTARHGKAQKNSKMGLSVAQLQSGSDTLVAAGAPGENYAYMFLVRTTADTCTRLETLAPDPGDPSILDEFGYSVAFAGHNVLVGSPGYQRYWKQDVDGLIHGFAFCPPGWVTGFSTPQTYGYEINLPSLIKMCVRCGPSQTSAGGRSTTCSQCAVTIPEKSTLDYGCTFKCDFGYFGTTCEVCSVVSVNETKPANSHWRDGVADCTWECDGGYTGSEDANGNRFCEQCGNTVAFEALNNVAWIVPTCEYECEFGFFRDPRPEDTFQSDRNCYSCSQIGAMTAEVIPENAEWMNGLDECIYGPLIGHNCTDDFLLCQACPAIPAQAHFTMTEPTKSPSRCEYECNAGYFGHPERNGVCVQCPDLMALNQETLPADGYWPTSPAGGVCDGNSWECSNGLLKSNLTKFCCPLQQDVPNSQPDQDYSPCQYSCRLGYRWVDQTRACLICPALKANAAWELDCNYTCLSNYYGKAEFDNCTSCPEYRQMLGTALPMNAYFPSTGTSCGAGDWECTAGYTKALQTVTAGCCPDTLPLETATKVTAGERPHQCDFKCKFQYGWNDVEKKCVSCPSWTNPAAPAFSEWDGYNCTYICKKGYVQQGRFEDGNLVCTDCSVYAHSQRWTPPSNGRWPNSSEITDYACDQDAWQCETNYERNLPGKLCCRTDALPSSQFPDKAVWHPTSCSWMCEQGYFPPQLTSLETSCLNCPDYLEDIPSCLSNCDGRIELDSPTECSASVQVTYQLTGLTMSTFTDAARRAFLSALATAAGKTQTPGDISITGMLEVGSRRAIGERVVLASIEHPSVSNGSALGGPGGRRAVTASSKTLQVFIQVNKVAARGRTVIEIGLSGASSALQEALGIAGITTVVSVLFAPNSIKGPGTFACASQYVYNELTNRCCNKDTFSKPPSDPARYLWLRNGCDWVCRSTYKGSDCLTCTEYKTNLWKPDGSAWDDTSPTCTFKCLTGFIKSDTGQSCTPLETLVKKCASSTRCADCTQLSDCVWCNDKCVPGSDVLSTGVRLTNGFGCSYLNSEGEAQAIVSAQGGIPVDSNCVCSASPTTCTKECSYKDCSSCLNDQYCGWCRNSSKCMLGSYSKPTFETCSDDWVSGSSAQCSQDISIWLIGLAVASASSAIVCCMCTYFVIRTRIAARDAASANQPVHFGAASVPSGGAQEGEGVRESVARFLHTFPTFEFSEERARENQPVVERTSSFDADGDDELVCTICLGTFCNGEECRMLPCLHVFHRACIDQWLGVSQECPLCKQSVLGKNDQSEAFAKATRRLAGGADLPNGPNDEETELAV